MGLLDNPEDNTFKRYHELCSDLNMDKDAADEAWESYERIRQNYILEVNEKNLKYFYILMFGILFHVFKFGFIVIAAYSWIKMVCYHVTMLVLFSILYLLYGYLNFILLIFVSAKLKVKQSEEFFKERNNLNGFRTARLFIFALHINTLIFTKVNILFTENLMCF